MSDAVGIDWYQIVTILGSGSAIATGATLLYNWRAKARELTLQKRSKRADWFVQSSGRYYRIGIIAGELEKRLGDPIIDFELCFYLIIQYLKAFKELYQKEASYFFDDIGGEFFLQFIENKINAILRGETLFGHRGWRLVRESLKKEQTVQDLHDLITSEGTEIKKFYDAFKSYLEKADNLQRLKKLFFVYNTVLLFEVNKLLISAYKNERKARRALANYYASPSLFKLEEELRPLIQEFKKQYNIDFKMFGWSKRIVFE